MSGTVTVEADWILRPVEPQDETFLEQLFCQVHASDFAGVPLPEQQVLDLIRMQARAQRMSYLRDFPAAQSSIVMKGANPIGRLLVDLRDDSMHLVDISILPEYQGRGFGTKLLQDLQRQAGDLSIPLQLSVLPQNPAVQLYSRLGFQVISGGMHLGMQWTPISNIDSLSTTKADATKPFTASAEESENLAALYTRLTGQNFQPDGASFVLVLDHVKHHRAIAAASFSLFFLGPLEPYLRQGNHLLHLLDSNGIPERDFVIFLGPTGPVENAMEYEAVFNI